MPNQSQQRTLSVRVSESLRGRLEALRLLAAERSGRRVSLSVVAKRLLESAREDEQEMLELRAHPTEGLVRIRDKGAARQLLSRTEWTFLSQYVFQGIEAFTDSISRPVARTSILGVLDAFRAVHDLRSGASSWDAIHLANLRSANAGPDGRPTGDQPPTSSSVRLAIQDARRRMTESPEDHLSIPYAVGRSLYKLLEEEELFGGMPEINRALLPYWHVLWPLAARGHYAIMDRPVRRAGREASVGEPPIPPVFNGRFRLTFSRLDGHELALLVAFPDRFGPLLSLATYPRLLELRRLVAELGCTPRACWDGRYLFGYVDTSGDHDDVWIRGHENGVSVGCTLEDWLGLRDLCERAWQEPEVQRAWEALALDYGEL